MRRINPADIPIIESAIQWTQSLPTFASRCCWVQESGGDWARFAPWPSQLPVLELLQGERFVVALKARQLGMTWMALFELMWACTTRPGTACGIFSLREEEAAAALRRLRLMWDRMHPLTRPRILRDNKTFLEFANGSSIRAFSTSSGDSYTFGLVLIDEADLIPDLDRVLRGAKPTIDAGGRLRLISRSDKSRPDSLFKAIYRAARDGQSEFKSIFLPWTAHPDRTQAWYDQQVAQALAQAGNRDFVLEQYPTTAEEALAPGESDKRIPVEWITRVLFAVPPMRGHSLESVAEVYEGPQNGARYVIGADPAEGNPTSDESAAVVLSCDGRHVATVRGRRQPAVFAAVLAQLSEHFNRANVLVERNNHGHAVLLALRENHPRVYCLTARDGKPGWLSSTLGKTALYDDLAEALRNAEVKIASPAVADQLQLIRGDTLRAPEGMHDDLADAYALAVEAICLNGNWGLPSSMPAVFKNPESKKSFMGLDLNGQPPGWNSREDRRPTYGGKPPGWS